jgi:hypothetical protein
VAIDIDGLVVAGEGSIEQKCLKSLHEKEAADAGVAARGVHCALAWRHGGHRSRSVRVRIKTFESVASTHNLPV